MPDIKILEDSISQHLTNTQNGQQHIFQQSTLNMPVVNYNYTKTPQNTVILTSSVENSQASIHLKPVGHTFYGLANMPAEFRKAMD